MTILFQLLAVVHFILFRHWYFHSVPTSQVSVDDSGAVVFAIQ